MNLTKPQEMIWQMEQFAGGAICVICTSLLRTGCRSEEALQNTVAWLYQHNDALRTRIRVTGSDVKQYVTEYVQSPVPVLRFAGMAELTEYAERYAKAPLDLTGTLCEISILLLPDQFGLLVKVHHLIADAWSMALLATQFNMLLDGKEPPCGSFQAYREREKSYLNSKRYAQDQRFFLNMLRDAGEPVLLSDRQTEDLSSERVCFAVSEDITSRIRTFAEQEKVSVLSVFSTVLAGYISRIHENAEQVFIGTTVLNRIDESQLHTAGMYVNTVPLRIQLGKDCSFRACLQQTEDMLMSVFRHQRYNYTLLQKVAAKERLLNGRLFDVMLHYVNASVEHADPTTQYLWHHNGIQNESLQIHIDDRSSQNTFCITYDYQTTKFSAEDIRRLHAHWMNMLEDAMDKPDKGCHALQMLSPQEQWQLQVGFNRTEKVYSLPDGATISSLFEENALQNPQKPCIFMDGNHVTYAEFLQRCRNIDAEIRRRTGNQKGVIAIIAQRSVQMYAALYGILRGGNAYLPILPETPKERVNYILKNSGASLVITEGSFTSLVEDVPCMDLWETFPEADAALACAAQPRDIAYVMYTSGSTGMPKGVKISHDSVINRILWMEDTYPLTKNGVILQKTVYCFDVSVWEIFWWGMCGGAMAIPLPGEHAIPAKLVHEICRNKVTHLHFVPSVFALFLEYLERRTSECSMMDTVKHIFLSGETLEADLVHRFYKLFDHKKVQLHNLYGPTECTVDVTYHDCMPDETLIPIGKPIYNTQIYITDHALNLLPIGITGELVIGGQNVGEGYMNEPELTAKRFVDNPFGDGKLYKTGDLAYLQDDGSVIYCGRMDQQVKINGQRIELEEIEAVVKTIPGVDTAAVIVKEHQGRKLLLACYCSSTPLDNAIRTACEKTLPYHMLPQPIRLDTLPLHPNGKLNRKELAQMQLISPQEACLEPPVNETEQSICDAFCRVLNLKAVGRNSDFFALGGDSLAVIAFLTESGYDQQLSAAQVIGNPTPAKLAALINGRQTDTMRHVQTIYKPEAATKSFVLFPFAGGDAEMYANLTKALRQRDDTVALYYVPYLHSLADCEAAAEEIAVLAKENEVCFYSHCAGAAVALCILQSIEQKHGDLIRHYYAAGTVPVKTHFAFNGWRCVPDRILLGILKKAGAEDDLLRSEKIGNMPDRFRQDTDFAAAFFSQKPVRCNCATTVLLGRQDLFTRFFKRAEKRWGRYVRQLDKLHYIETKSHYFQSERSDALAQLLLHEN